MSAKNTQHDAKITSQMHDALMTEGVGAKGYGVLPKFPMLDEALTLEAKAIYAYLCSYTGRGATVFPGRERILDDLGVNKDTYYKHFRLLLEQGYLTVQQSRSATGFFKNIYTIVSCPEKFRQEAEAPHLADTYTRIRVSGLKGAGYGFIPKSVMCDHTLSLKAKGLYGYYCAFTGAGACAHPKRDAALAHLGISAKLLAKYLRELKAHNYIEVSQQFNEQGRFGVNEITVVDRPDPAQAQTARRFAKVAPCTRFSDTEGVFSCGQISDTQKSDGDFSEAENSDANTTSVTNKNKAVNNNKTYNITPEEKARVWWRSRAERYALLGYDRFQKSFSTREEREQRRVLREILAQKSLPEGLLQKRVTAVAAVALMTEDALCGSRKFYDEGAQGEEAFQTFCLCRDCLVELISSKREQYVSGVCLRPEEVYRLLGRYITVNDSDVRFFLPIEEAQENYRAAMQEKEIVNPVGYMKSCLYNALLTGDLPLG